MHRGKDRTRIVVIGALLLALALPAMAVSVAVTNYNWLDLTPLTVTPFVGSADGTGGNGNGAPIDIRWGGWVWIPDGNRTNNGDNGSNGDDTYWGGVNLGGVRPVKEVRTEFWVGEGTGLQKFYIDGTTDGTTWAQVGSYDFGSMQLGLSSVRLLSPVVTLTTPGNYSAVRIRFVPGDYQYGSGARGGPGIFSIEPRGDGTADSSEVNWANQPSFATTVINNNCGFGGTRYVDGYVYDDDGTRTGSGPGNWPATTYAQIDLKTARQVNQVATVWDYVWNGTGYRVQYSNDGVNFFYVTGQSVPISYGTGAYGALWYSFNDVTARYFRISDMTTSGSGQYGLMNQVLLWAPEPASALLLGLGGLVLLKRQRKP